MPFYLTDAVVNLLAPMNGPHPAGGSTVPNSGQPPFVNATDSNWVLVGQYLNSGGPYTAETIYTSPNGAFTFNAQGQITGLNASFFQTANEIFPSTTAAYQTLTANLPNALAGNAAAQDACRLALMTFTAQINGHTVLPGTGSQMYSMVMTSSTWYGFGQWAIGIQCLGAGGVVTYQQKNAGSPLQYNCGALWNQGQPLTTTLLLDGLLQPQVNMLNNVG